jgi:hypothetical protein
MIVVANFGIRSWQKTSINIPDNVDGGAGSMVVTLFIGAVFAAVGGVLGGSAGLLLGAIWHLTTGTKAPMSKTRENVLKPGTR